MRRYLRFQHFAYFSLLARKEVACYSTGNLSHVRLDVSSTITSAPSSIATTTQIFDPQGADPLCFRSWLSWIMEWQSSDDEYVTARREQTVTSMFETIESVGPSEVYSIWDGIPRLKFYGSPNYSTSRTVLVTKTETWWGSVPVSAGNDTQKKHVMETKQPACRLPLDDCTRLGTLAYSIGLGRGNQTLWLYYNWANASSPGFSINTARFNQACPEKGVDGKGRPFAIACQIDVGDEVVLLHWPPNSTTGKDSPADNHGLGHDFDRLSASSSIFTTTAITFKGQDLYYRGMVFSNGQTDTFSPLTYVTRSVLYGNWTFTSPSIYLAHRPITASVGSYWETQHVIETLRPAGIFAINPGDVYSMRPVRPGMQGSDGYRYAQLVAHGDFNPFIDPTDPGEWLPVDFRQMDNPVSAELYYDARSEDCWGKQSHCGTITDDSYRPQLSINMDIWSSVVPKEYDYCNIPFVVDPPIRLEPMSGGLSPPTLPSFADSPVSTPADSPNGWPMLDHDNVNGGRPFPWFGLGGATPPRPRPPIAAPTPSPTTNTGSGLSSNRNGENSKGGNSGGSTDEDNGADPKAGRQGNGNTDGKKPKNGAAGSITNGNGESRSDGSLLIDGQMLLPGQQITVSGTTLSLGPSASYIVVNGRTSTIALGSLTIDGTVYAEATGVSGAYVVGGKVGSTFGDGDQEGIWKDPVSYTGKGGGIGGKSILLSVLWAIFVLWSVFG